MKRILLSAAAFALAGTFAIGGAASAQPYGDYHHDNGYHRGYYDRGAYDRNGYYDHGYYRHGDYRPVRYQSWRNRSDWRRSSYTDWNRGYGAEYHRHHPHRLPYGYYSDPRR